MDFPSINDCEEEDLIEILDIIDHLTKRSKTFASLQKQVLLALENNALAAQLPPLEITSEITKNYLNVNQPVKFLRINRFTESRINNLLKNGLTANDIENATVERITGLNAFPAVINDLIRVLSETLPNFKQNQQLDFETPTTVTDNANSKPRSNRRSESESGKHEPSFGCSDWGISVDWPESEEANESSKVVSDQHYQVLPYDEARRKSAFLDLMTQSWTIETNCNKYFAKIKNCCQILMPYNGRSYAHVFCLQSLPSELALAILADGGLESESKFLCSFTKRTALTLLRSRSRRTSGNSSHNRANNRNNSHSFPKNNLPPWLTNNPNNRQLNRNTNNINRQESYISSTTFSSIKQ